MAILTKSKIKDLARATDLLGSNYLEENINSCSYDLRIGTINKDGKIYSREHRNIESFIEIKPSEIVTMLTLEVVHLPNNMAGTVFAINQMSSRGLLILNPGHIDAGFKGPISVCAINLSRQTINLSLEESIFTIILSTLSEPLPPEDLYYSGTFDKLGRKAYEKSYYDDKFSKMSNSIFDLVLGYKKSTALLVKESFRWIGTKAGVLLSITATVAGIVGGIYLFWPDSVIFGKKMKSDIEEKHLITISKKDSIINAKDSILLSRDLEISTIKNNIAKPIKE